MPIALGLPPGIALPASSGNPAIDLTTAQHAANVLAAAGLALTGPQAQLLPSLITAASREIVRYCGRKFALGTYSEIVTPEGARQDRGEPATAKLTAFPVVDVSSVMTGRATVLTVTNGDTSTNQYAQIAFATTGDVEYLDLSYTGLVLSRVASGVTANDTLVFADNPTLAGLAAAINALGHGWTATVQASYEKHPSASLVGGREPKNALSTGAALDLFTQAASGYDIDRASGILRCYATGFGSGLGIGGWGGSLGDPWGAAWDGLGGIAGGMLGWGQWQVNYRAGWATVPENLQLVCAEVVKLSLDRLKLNGQMKSQSGGSDLESWSWTARDALQALPEWATTIMNYYKDYSV